MMMAAIPKDRMRVQRKKVVVGTDVNEAESKNFACPWNAN
jgi:hypothetical protein